MALKLHDFKNLIPLLQVAGGRNVPGPIMYVAIKSIENSRKMRYQSLNAYRKRFSMKPYTSFEDMTGETNSTPLTKTDTCGWSR